MENATGNVKTEPVSDSAGAMHNPSPPSISHNTNDNDSESTITDNDHEAIEGEDSSDEEEGTVIDVAPEEEDGTVIHVAQSNEGEESSDDEEVSDSEDEYSPPTNRRRISLGPDVPLTRSRARMTRRLSDHLAPPRAGSNASLAVRRLSSHNGEP